MTGKTGSRLATAVLLPGWMAVIFAFSAQPAAESSRLSGFIARHIAGLLRLGVTEAQLEQIASWLEYPVRKAAHMTEYAILGLLLYWLLCAWYKEGRQSYMTAFALAVCYAVTDEVHQVFVPGRSGQASDVCVDAAGALLGLLAGFFLGKIRKALRKRRASSTIK